MGCTAVGCTVTGCTVVDVGVVDGTVVAGKVVVSTVVGGGVVIATVVYGNQVGAKVGGTCIHVIVKFILTCGSSLSVVEAIHLYSSVSSLLMLKLICDL